MIAVGGVFAGKYMNMHLRGGERRALTGTFLTLAKTNEQKQKSMKKQMDKKGVPILQSTCVRFEKELGVWLILQLEHQVWCEGGATDWSAK